MMISLSFKSIFSNALIKISVTSIIAVIAFFFLFEYLVDLSIEKTILQRKSQIIQIVTLAKNTIEPILIELRNKDINKEEAVVKIRNIVRNMTYSDQHGSNYIFMSAYDGTMLVQPYDPNKELTNQILLKDVNGKFIIKELIKTARTSKGRGFVSYYYYPPNSDEPEEKLAYVIGLKEIQCYIGTGKYLQEIQKEQKLIIKNAQIFAIIILILLNIPIVISIIEMQNKNRLLAEEIREKQKVQQSLIINEERLKLAMESVNDGIWDWNMIDNEFYFSPKWYTILGYKQNEFNSSYDNFINLLYPEDIYSTQTQINKVLKKETDEYSAEFRMVNKNGDLQWIYAQGKVVSKNSLGEPLRMIGTHTDITERKNYENMLYQREVKLSAIFNSVNDAIFIHKSDFGKILDCNETACNMYGYTKTEMLNLNVSDLSVNTETFNQFEAAALINKAQKGDLVIKEWYARKKSGEFF